MTSANPRHTFARMVLLEVSPTDAPLFEDFVAASDDVKDGKEIGTDFGVVEVAAMVGPVAVWLAQKVFDHLLSWAAEIGKKTIEGFLVDSGKAKLKAWLAAPDKQTLKGALTANGRAEIMGLVAALSARSKLPPSEIRKITSRIAAILFGDEGK